MGTRTLITVAEFEKLPDDGNLHELDEGELIVMPPPQLRHGIIQLAVGEALRRAARVTGGLVATESGFRLGAETVQAPDVAYISKENREKATLYRYPQFGPDIAVEILSPDYNAARLHRKITHYFNAGTKIVWVLDPESVTVTVYEKSGAFRTLEATALIDAPELLPGFSAPVSSLFRIANAKVVYVTGGVAQLARATVS